MTGRWARSQSAINPFEINQLRLVLARPRGVSAEVRQAGLPPRSRFAFGREGRRAGVLLLLLGALVAQVGCTTRVELRREDFVTQSIRRVAPTSVVGFAEAAAAQGAGDFVLVGQGESMQPYYAAGTAIVVRPTSYFMLRPGMPVVYESGSGRRVAHVLVAKGSTGWRVRGVANATEDHDVVTPQNLLGVVRYAFVPDGGESRDQRLAGM